MSDWQPMETAPKDGSKILGYDGDDMGVIDWGQTSIPYGRMAWCIGRCEGEYNVRNLFYAKYWMPLPAPPSKEDQP